MFKIDRKNFRYFCVSINEKNQEFINELVMTIIRQAEKHTNDMQKADHHVPVEDNRH